MITWEPGGAGGRGLREPGAGSGAGMGGGGGTHRDLAGVLVADLLHLLTAVGCAQRGVSETAEVLRAGLPRLPRFPKATAPRAVRPLGRGTERGWNAQAPAQN